MSDCQECGRPLLWGGMSWVEHTEGWHAVTRKIWLRAALRRLTEELHFREEAQYVAMRDDVLVVWRVVLPADVLYAQSIVPGVTWDGLHREELLAGVGRGALDWLETTRKMRIHPSRLTYRVFDEREK